MSKPTPSSARWTVSLGSWLFFAVGALLVAGALTLRAWWPGQAPPTPEEPPIASQPIRQQAPPILLPETPLRDEMDEAPVADVFPAPAASATPLPAAPTPEPISVPQRLVIPSIDLDAPITAVGWTTINVNGQSIGQWQVPNEQAVGWHSTSAGLGQVGNTVLNGHHNIYGEVFRNLVDLQVGDTVRLTGEGTRASYTVTQTLILPERDQPIDVRLANAQHILPTSDQRITLISCWPYSSNSHRLVIVAEPVTIASQFDILDG